MWGWKLTVKITAILDSPQSQCQPLQCGFLHPWAEQGAHTLSDFTRWLCWFSSNPYDTKCHCVNWFPNNHSFKLHTSPLKHREVKWLGQGCTADEWWTQGLNPGSQPQCHGGYWQQILHWRLVLRPRSQPMGILSFFLNKLRCLMQWLSTQALQPLFAMWPWISSWTTQSLDFLTSQIGVTITHHEGGLRKHHWHSD